MKKRSRYRPINPTAGFLAVFNSTPTAPAEVTRIMVLIRTAYQRLKDGHGTHDDFDRLAACINVGMIRAEQIGGGEPVVRAMQDAGQAMLEADRLREAHGRYGFTGLGLVALSHALDAYEVILAASSPNQMQAAVEEGADRMRRGEVLHA